MYSVLTRSLCGNVGCVVGLHARVRSLFVSIPAALLNFPGAASKEQQLTAEKQGLQSQVEALSHQKERLQLEVDAATTRAANNEKQQQELYDLCNTLQGVWGCGCGVLLCLCTSGRA